MSAVYPPLSEETLDDAVRDALALVRAAFAGDPPGAAAVAVNLSAPPVTAMVLAWWLADATPEGTQEERMERLAAWQRDVGL